ncbi:DUF1295 domain-containing protein [Paenibacillus sp. MMS18-CY102]|nr:DUF1295 domain-containing protein [Paenibacillus sp. MMS18-CY102]
MKGRRLLPPQLFLIGAIGMLVMRLYCPYDIWLPFPYNLAGILVVGSGLGMAIWGSRAFRRYNTNIHTFKEPGRLVVEGLFKYTRNPMYLGFLVALAGLFIVLGAVSPFVIVVLFLVITNQWYIKFEEHALADKFGQEYEAYKASTRRWI